MDNQKAHTETIAGEEFTIHNEIITDPGRFEGEARYVPHYWKLYLEGAADRDDRKVLGFDISPEDKTLFPELKKRRTVKLCQWDDGFICEV